MDKELQEKLQAYKESLTEEEKKRTGRAFQCIRGISVSTDRVEDLEKIPVLQEKIFQKRLSQSSMKKKRIADVPVVYHEIETNGNRIRGCSYSICQVWKKQIFRMSESCRSNLESLIPRIMSTENSLMRSTCIPAVSEHHWNCIQTFPKCRKKNSKQHLKSKERHYIRSCQSYSG